MLNDDINPPGIVRQAEASLGDLAVEIKHCFSAAEDDAKQGAARYRRVGELLNRAQERVPKNQWTAWVEANVPFSLRHAQRYMRLARSDTNVASDDQWRIICGHAPEPVEQKALPTMRLCRACRVSGRPKPGCKDCAAVNADYDDDLPAADYEAAVANIPAADGTVPGAPAREPGSDDGEIDQEQERYDLKQIEKAYKPLWREYRRLAKIHGIGNFEKDPRFVAVIRQGGRAKDAMKRLVWQLQGRKPAG